MREGICVFRDRLPIFAISFVGFYKISLVFVAFHFAKVAFHSENKHPIRVSKRYVVILRATSVLLGGKKLDNGNCWAWTWIALQNSRKLFRKQNTGRHICCITDFSVRPLNFYELCVCSSLLNFILFFS